MSIKGHRNKPPTEKTETKKKTKSETPPLPHDDIRRLLSENPTLTPTEVLTKLNMEITQSTRSRIGKFLRSIRETKEQPEKKQVSTTFQPGKNQGNISITSNTIGKLATNQIPLETSSSSGENLVETRSDGGRNEVGGGRNEVDAVVEALKEQVITGHMEGIAKKIILNPRILYWYSFAVSEGFAGDMGDFLSDAVEDFYGRRNLYYSTLIA